MQPKVSPQKILLIIILILLSLLLLVLISALIIEILVKTSQTYEDNCSDSDFYIEPSIDSKVKMQNDKFIDVFKNLKDKENVEKSANEATETNGVEDYNDGEKYYGVKNDLRIQELIRKFELKKKKKQDRLK